VRHGGDPLPALGLHKGEAFLEDLSLLMPQRYFHNLGRILSSNTSHVDRPGERGKFALNRAFEANPKLWSQIQQWRTPDPEQRPTNKQFRHFFRFLFWRLMLPEIAALVVLNTIYLVIACQRIQKGEHYHVLR